VKVYIPILVLAVLALGFAVFSVAMGTWVAGPKRWNKAKMEAYECGIEPTPQPARRWQGSRSSTT
jgi:NADH-quinone oxidoreductase subunit A